MSKKCKWTLYSIATLIGIVIVVAVIKFLFFSGVFVPLIELNGASHVQMEANSNFEDEGATATFRFHDYSDNIVKESNLDTTKLGTYTVRYTFLKYAKSVERTVEVKDTIPPTLKLNGTDTIRVFENTNLDDPGVNAFDNYDGDISAHVKIQNEVDMSRQGTYQILYQINDSSGNSSEIRRTVEVCEDPTATKVYYNHDDYDNKAEEWWFNKSEDHKRTTAARDEQFLNTYDAYVMGEDEKVIYLTFDEGGNDITYIHEIADVLNDNQVTATFFLTRNYIRDNAQFMNDLVSKGHVIGNHTWHHYDMPTLANAQDIDKFVLEITETEKTYMQVTGQPMKKVFRFPKGGMSERALKITQDLGYTNYFWSHAYYDYASDVSKDDALKTLMDHYHNGAIYLLHPSNKGNYLAMDTFIKNMKELGYEFKTVDAIPEDVQVQN